MVYLLASLPNGGMWHPGDGHVHTDGLAYKDYVPSQYFPGREDLYGYSDAWDNASVWIRRDQANSKGMQWIVVTDHAGTAARCPTQARLDPNDEWLVYKQACQLATTQYSPTVTVCPAEELATKESGEAGESGHLLSYANPSYAASYGTCQDLINQTTGNGGFGVIAHPFNGFGFGWFDWNAAPWGGLEIMSNESTPNANAIIKWDQQLLNRLGDEIAGNYWCVGMANSDVHTSSSAGWAANMNYIYTGSYSAPGTSPTVVWDAIRNGRSTASSDGSFAAATVNGFYPGSHTTVVRNSTVYVFVTGTPLSTKGYTNAQVRIIKNGSLTTQNIPIDGISNFTTTIPITVSQNCYIRVEVTYTSGSQTGYCLVNPVFIGTSN